MTRFAIALLLIVLATAPVEGSEPAGTAEPASPAPYLGSEFTDGGGLFSAVLRLAGSLLVIIALIVITVYVLRLVMVRKPGTLKDNQMISVLEHAYLGPNKELCLVRVLDRVLVVAVNGNEIRLLSEMQHADSSFPGVLTGEPADADGQDQPVDKPTEVT